MRTGPPFLTGAALPAGTDHLSHLYKEPDPIGGHDVNEVLVFKQHLFPPFGGWIPPRLCVTLRLLCWSFG